MQSEVPELHQAHWRNGTARDDDRDLACGPRVLLVRHEERAAACLGRRAVSAAHSHLLPARDLEPARGNPRASLQGRPVARAGGGRPSREERRPGIADQRIRTFSWFNLA